MRKKILLILMLLPYALFAQALVSKIIPIRYADPKALIAALNPILKPGESITSLDRNMVLNVSEDTLQRLRPMIHQLDVPPMVFLVSIHQGTEDWLNQASDTITYSTHGGGGQSNDQSVQVLNGASAFISTGSDYPVISQVEAGWVTGVSYGRIQTQKGMLVKPQLQGDRVKLTIQRFNNTSNAVNPQQVEMQQTATSTLIPFNQWVNISQTTGPESQSNQGNISYQAGSNGSQNKGNLYIKVTKVGSGDLSLKGK
jgi:hypothetical protein